VEEAWRVLRGDGKGECWVSEVKSRFGKVGRKQQKNGVVPGKNGKKVKPKKKKDEDDEDDLGEEIFAENARSAGNDVDETDISAFVEVFRTRGFSLKQESVDKSNKMFVKMEFVKTRGTSPTRGKYVVAPAASYNAKFGKKKFVEREDTGVTVEDESKVLKPCVYKIR
jgi:ribosomal RNA-processing protein 8